MKGRREADPSFFISLTAANGLMLKLIVNVITAYGSVWSLLSFSLLSEVEVRLSIYQIYGLRNNMEASADPFLIYSRISLRDER